MNAANQRQLTPVLAAIAVLLGALLLVLFAGVGRSLRWDAPRTQASLPPAGNPSDLPRPVPLQQFALVWQKPLFTPDRKPIARVANGGSSLGDFDLTGIILTSGLRMALLHDRNGDRQVRLHEGESLPDGSVTLVEVRPRSALFDTSAGRTELKLPAGAPIDSPKEGTPPPDNGNRNAPSDAMMRVVPPGPPSAPAPPSSNSHSPESSVERLRENIQKRRAAQAAATHQGVR
jgi:general secretion pathway protein N